MPTTEQLVEESIKNHFAKPLPTAQYDLVARIIREVFYETENLSFEEFELHVKQLEQEFADIPEGRFAYLFLQKIAGEAIETHFNKKKENINYLKEGIEQAKVWLVEDDASIRVVTLLLYSYLGSKQGELGQVAKSIKTFQQGLEYAQNWLDDDSVWEKVLELYYNLGLTQGKLGQVAKAIEIFEQGLDYAKNWLDDASVWKRVLALYFALGVIQGESGHVEKKIKTYEQGLEYAQNWLDDASVWKQVLALYLNLGITQGELGHIEKEIKAYEQGLDYAQNWLDDASVWKQVLESYNNLVAHLKQTGSDISQYFPVINFLLWQVELDKKDDEIAVIENQNNNLYYLSSSNNITNYFHNFTQQLITKFHNPDKPHRHLSTDQLLRLSEGLYLINALQERYPLHNAYTKLALLTKLEAAWQTEIGQPFSNCLQTALPAWQQIFPNTNFPLQAETPSISQLEQQVKDLSWYKHLWYRSQVKTLRQASQTSQAILDLDIKFKMRRLHPWHKMLTETNEALIEWLKFGILNYLPLPTGLSDRASVMLGIIFVYGKPDPLDNNWLSNIELVINAVRKSKILDWANGSEKKRLNSWLDKQTILMRNKLAIEISGQEQDTEEWRNTENMLINIKVAYASIQPQIEPLARIFTALKQDNLTTPIDKILETNSIDSDSRKLAIESLICGTSQRELSTAISKWLHKNGNIRCFNVSTAITKNQQNFERISQIYPLTWTQTNWDEQVNKWTKILIQETLATNNITKLWEILERTRIGFTSTTKANSLITWSEKTGLALKTAFEESINTRKKNKPNPNEPWPPLIAWSQALDTLIPTPPTIAECQAKLDDSALIQLFLDEQNLSALWLDQNGLQLRDLPDFTVNITSWNNATETLGKKGKGSTDFNQTIKNMEAVVDELQPFAKILSEWATGLEQITIIFPAPLGQLPWETLEELEDILVRAVSLNTWLQESKVNLTTKKSCIICDPSADETCTVKEANWLAKRFTTTVDSPSHFEALQKFSDHQHIHLTTHGKYEPKNPTASRLSLNAEDGIELPIWMLNATKINADLIILSACESNLTGEATKELLKPIGIGPNLIAAGAKTVVGTLWAYDGFAALCFSYYFYQISEQNPTMDWHIVTTQARYAVRDMTHTDLETIIEEFDLKNAGEPCWDKVVEAFYGESHNKNNAGCISKPFAKFNYWAGFIVLGQRYGNS